MKIHEDRSHMNIDTRWFEKGYAKEDVHSLRLQSLCTEAEAAANKQFYDSHTREEWDACRQVFDFLPVPFLDSEDMKH